MRNILILPLLLSGLALTGCSNGSVASLVDAADGGPDSPINSPDTGVFGGGESASASGGGTSGGTSGGSSAGGSGAGAGSAGAGGSSSQPSNSVGNEPGVGSGSQPVPEPGTLLLVGSGLAGFGASLLRRRRKIQPEPEQI